MIVHMSDALAPSRDQIIDFLARYIGEKGYSPSNREIAAAIGVTVSNVHFHLVKLRQMGRITFLDGQNRTIRLVPNHDASVTN